MGLLKSIGDDAFDRFKGTVIFEGTYPLLKQCYTQSNPSIKVCMKTSTTTTTTTTNTTTTTATTSTTTTSIMQTVTAAKTIPAVTTKRVPSSVFTTVKASKTTFTIKEPATKEANLTHKTESSKAQSKTAAAAKVQTASALNTTTFGVLSLSDRKTISTAPGTIAAGATDQPANASDTNTTSDSLNVNVVVAIVVVLLALLLLASGTACYFYKKNRTAPVFNEPEVMHNIAFETSGTADTQNAYETPSSRQRQMYDDANELRRNSQRSDDAQRSESNTTRWKTHSTLT